jgi:hypothetical protein
MSTTYTKSLNTDFGGSIIIQQFHKEVEAIVGITPNIIAVTLTGDEIEILFDTPLSAGEETILNSIISSHVPNYSKPKVQFYTVTAQVQKIKTTSYSKTIRFNYPGSDNSGAIDYVEVISNMDAGVTSYNIRLYDKTNDKIMAELTNLTNTADMVHDFGTISHIPANNAILEIHIKKNGGSSNLSINIDSATVYYGN